MRAAKPAGSAEVPRRSAVNGPSVPFATGKVICSVDEINFTIPYNNREAFKEMLDAEAGWTET